jgi:RHS repeat-associated protein
MLRSGTTSYYHVDGIGSVTSLSSGAGALAQTYTFDSFGKQTASSGSLTNPFQYTAREFDAETSLYFYRARYYSADTGRFITADPIGFGGGLNFYRYTLNNPVLFNDPMGLWKNTGKPANRNINTIVCNGQGGIGVQLGAQGTPEQAKCLGDCMRAHENSHKLDLLASNPTICKGSVAGIQVAFSNVTEQKDSEIRALAVEIICLLNKEKAGCGPCKQIIDDRIKQIRAYRDSFKN